MPDPTRRSTPSSVSLGYHDRMIVDRLSLSIPTGRVTAIVGANACGKSTLLRGLARLLAPTNGSVLLDGQDIARAPDACRRRPARHPAPTADRSGRPHRRRPRRRVAAIPTSVGSASGHRPTPRRSRTHSRVTGMSELGDRLVDELSGGQRQRAWIALALAQGAPLMLLDEPTTFLDLAHQVEVLDLLADLNERDGRTIVMVLHDLNLACRYADHLVAMGCGTIVAEGGRPRSSTPPSSPRCSDWTAG